MRRRTKIALGVAAIPLGLVAIVLIAVFVLTQTDFGRERVRRLALGQLEGSVNGTIEVGRIGGNLLSGATLTDISITDSTGAPFFEADTLSLSYSIRALLSQRIYLSDVRLVDPAIVLNKPPGEEWNFARTFPSDTTAPEDTTATGFGSWVRITDLTVRDGRLVVRNEWMPDDSLSGPARDSAIAEALSEESRARVVRVEGGFQSIQDFRNLNTRMPLLRLADPDSTDILVEVAALSTDAYLFRPPAAHIRDLAGRFLIAEDSLYFRDVRAALPDSRLAAEGAFVTESGNLRVALRAAPVSLGDLQWIYPPLPDSGAVSVALDVARRGERTHVIARELDLRMEGARLTGHAEITAGDSPRLGPTELAFSGFDTRLAERFAPDAELPVDGVLNGRLALTGDPAALDVDGRAVFTERGGGTSRVFVDGEIGTMDGFVARDLRLRFDPVRVALARAAMPDLPVGGTITGQVTVNGAADTRLAVATDLVHQAPTGRTRLTGDAAVAMGETRRFDVDLRAAPVSLNTAGRFAPAAGLRGSATGAFHARGTLGDLALALDFAVPDGGSIEARGTFDLESERKRYDFETRFVDFDAGALSTEAPHTAVTGTLMVQGRGTDPATLQAIVRADLANTQVDSVGVDTARLLVRVADGLATIEEGTVQLASARAEVEGSFGLAGNRNGTIRYLASVDSLSDFARYLPADSAAESRPVDGIPMDTALPADSLMGSLRIAGVVAGNPERFDLRGTAELDDVVVRGNALRSGRIEYQWLDALTPGASLALDAALGSVRAGGLALDSVSTHVRHREGPREGVRSGTAAIAIYQDTERDYRFRSDYQLALEGNEVRLADVVLRFDTTRWTSTQPGIVRWGGGGIEVETLDLRDGADGRIYVDGRLPAEGVGGDLEIAIERLRIGDIAALLQDSAQATGLLSFHANAEGTLRDPRFQGEIRLVDLEYGETALPVLETRFGYADTELEVHTELLRHGGQSLVVAEGSIPVNLALADSVGERLLDRPMSFDVQADSLPLDALPESPDAFTGLRGYITGTVAIRGTPEAPEVDGTVNLNDGSVNLVQPGLALRNIGGTLRIREDAVFIDSLVAFSDGGPIRLAGELDITTPAEPGFDLAIVARNAEMLDNDQAYARLDADLAITGPFDGVEVTGDIDVREGVIYIPDSKDVIELDDPALIALLGTAGIEPGVLPEPNPLLDNLRVDMGIRISRDTWVRQGTDANIEIYTPAEAGALTLQLDQQEQAFILEGTVSTDRGVYNFAGRQFAVDQGSVVFLGDPGINPLLQITAQYQVPQPGRRAIAILINIGGTLTEPMITLDSNAQPPLSQSDLISYLAFGTSSTSLLSQGGSGLSGGGAGSGDLPALATQKLTGIALGAMMDDVVEDLESGGMRDLGLDVFRISPAELPSEVALDGAINLFRGTEFEAGKYLTPSIFVAGQGRPADAWPGARVEYRTPAGFRGIVTLEPRYLPSEPTLSSNQEPRSTNVFGAFVRWEWRF